MRLFDSLFVLTQVMESAQVSDHQTAQPSAGRNATDQIREPQAEHVDGANPVGSNPPSERTDQ